MPIIRHDGATKNNGIHGQQNMLRIMKKTELELLAETLEKLFGRAR